MTPIVKLTLFISVSALILRVSWRSLPDPRSHGFYRFFAFEALLVLFLLNANSWFLDPLSIVQLISWALLLASFYLVVHGVYLLIVIGQPQGDIENTQNLVVQGIYKYIRHPLYASLLFLAWGIFCKAPSLLGVTLAGMATIFLVLTAQVEEAENIEKFGEEYAEYMKKTNMFVPFIF